MPAEERSANSHRARAAVALLLLVPVQSISAVVMLFAFPGVTGKVLASLCRVWMLAFPIVWTIWVEGRRPQITAPTRGGLLAGFATGLAMFAIMLTAYGIVAERIDLGPLRARAVATGFANPAPFAAVFAYIIVVNAILEEYVWRWFVYRQVEAIVPASFGPTGRTITAVAGAAALFTAHHVILLAAWVGPAVNALASAGVFIGALIWSTLFARTRSLWPCYLSHALADAAILVMGYDLLFRSAP